MPSKQSCSYWSAIWELASCYTTTDKGQKWYQQTTIAQPFINCPNIYFVAVDRKKIKEQVLVEASIKIIAIFNNYWCKIIICPELTASLAGLEIKL